MEKVPMTQRGFEALKEELRRRQQEERPRIIQAISEARAHGDLSENAEYHAAKESQSLNEGRISELEDLTARAEVIDVTKMSGDKIKFGATVKLVDEETDEERSFQIVGEQEADERRRHRGGRGPGRRPLLRSSGSRLAIKHDGKRCMTFPIPSCGQTKDESEMAIPIDRISL